MVASDIACPTVGPQYSRFVSDEEGLNASPVELEKSEEMEKRIVEISLFLMEQYGVDDTNIELSIYSGKSPWPGTINGVRYELNDIKYKIMGEIFIVFMVYTSTSQPYYTFSTRPYYIFRTEIDKAPGVSMEAYNTFAKDIVALSDSLELRMNFKEAYIRDSPYWEPIFYQKQEKVDVSTFKKFMEHITYIAKAFPLKMPKRRQYADCGR